MLELDWIGLAEIVVVCVVGVVVVEAVVEVVVVGWMEGVSRGWLIWRSEEVKVVPNSWFEVVLLVLERRKHCVVLLNMRLLL